MKGITVKQATEIKIRLFDQLRESCTPAEALIVLSLMHDELARYILGSDLGVFVTTGAVMLNTGLVNAPPPVIETDAKPVDRPGSKSSN